MNKAVLYTDGSACVREDRTFMCGYSFVIVQDGKPIYGEGLPGMGTINQAEMCGVYMGMKCAQSLGITITEVYTDSTYVVNGLRSNMGKLQTGDWVNANGSETSNKDMWVGLCKYWGTLTNPPQLIHVKGHTGLPFNELCDTMAKEAAISQKPVQCWFSPDKCSEYGTTPPMCVQPIPAPAVPGEAEEGFGISRVVGQYTDDRAKACHINYPGLRVFASRCVSVWEQTQSDNTLSSMYRIHPVQVGEVILPLYKYRVEVGTPLQVMLTNSEIQWQGEEFTDMLRRAVNTSLSEQADLILASYNHVGAVSRGLQGIYMLCRKPDADTGRISEVYRSERVEHGRYLNIPNDYLDTLGKVLSDDTTACGLIHTEDDRYCLLVTGSLGGMLISSSVLPSTVTCEGLQLIAKGSAKVKIGFSNTEVAKRISKQYVERELVGTTQMYDLLADTDYTPVNVITPEEIPQVFVPITDIPQLNNMPEPETDKSETLSEFDSLVAEYNRVTEDIDRLNAIRADLFKRIIDATVKYPVMTPHEVQKIEANVRAALQEKLNSLFI